MFSQPKSVIILEDDEDIADLFSQLLSSYGARPIICKCEKEILNALKSADIALALLDIMLPEIDGRNIASLLKERNVDFPVYFMTGISPQSIGDEHLKKTAGVLRKPFSIMELRDLLDKHLTDTNDGKIESHAGRKLLELMTTLASEKENFRRESGKIINLVAGMEPEIGEKSKILSEQLKELNIGIESSLNRVTKQIAAIKELTE